MLTRASPRAEAVTLKDIDGLTWGCQLQPKRLPDLISDVTMMSLDPCEAHAVLGEQVRRTL